MTTLARLSQHSGVEGRTGDASLLVDQLGHAARGLWRSRIVLVFTFILPLMWLNLIGLVAGNDVVDPSTGVRTMQYVTPMAAVLGLVFAAYPPVATSLSLAREQGVLKRLRGTPLPIWLYLLGQVLAAVALAGVALLVMLGIGIAVYGVQIEWRSALASVVTLGIGIACLAALGLAVGAVARSAATAQAFAMATAVAMGFVSGLFNAGGNEPAWMGPVGALFPMRNIADPLRQQFDPYGTGSGWNPGAIAVLAAWGVVCLVIAGWALRREPATTTARAEVAPAGRGAGAPAEATLRSTFAGRPSVAALTADQSRWAIRGASRVPSLVFFGIAMPVGLFALVCSTYPSTSGLVHGMPVGVWFAAAMTAYGAGVVAFMHLPTNLAAARDHGALKRLRGTPLPVWIHLTGRTIEVLVLAALIAVLILVVGSAAFGVRVDTTGLLAFAAVLAFGTLTLAACGFAIAALVPTARAVSVVTMAILLPLSFVSDIFVVGGIPEPVATFASLFPLKHFVAALAATLDPAGWTIAWTDLAVMAVWLAVASGVAVRRFRWQPTLERGARVSRTDGRRLGGFSGNET